MRVVNVMFYDKEYIYEIGSIALVPILYMCHNCYKMSSMKCSPCDDVAVRSMTVLI